jgi:hypothetical protein
MVLEVDRQPDFEGFERATKFDVATEVVRYICQRVGRETVRGDEECVASWFAKF